MNRAIVTAFHKYTPFGDQYYEPIFKHFMDQMNRYRDEFDRLYILDSNWGVTDVPSWTTVIKVNPHLRYFDAYKEVLPQIKEDLVLLLDNDFLIYRKGIINHVFFIIEQDHRLPDHVPYDAVSIIDNIGTYKTDKLKNGNKMCPYLFATRKELLMKYKNIEWGDHMPHSETLGLLTEAMLNDNLRPYELEEDKSNILFDGTQDGEKSKDLGYYHIRSGSLPAYLLATRAEGDRKTYEDYLKHQPKTEYLRQFAWFWVMGGSKYMDRDLMTELGVDYAEWLQYIEKFRAYYGLNKNGF